MTDILLPFIVSYLTHEESLIKSKIKFVDNKIERFDAVIATVIIIQHVILIHILKINHQL